MPRLEWKIAAVSDLLAIIDYISDDNPDAAQALKNEIEEKVSRLPTNPHLYRVGRVDGTREMVVRPNYIVVYSETPEVVTILRVLHAAQLWP
ncbi:type II toxin-antitoxin system RelE/ParE family toxin [Pontivivens ytuae]|uniref:Type II toxin-antitoxin system RelE/ParE family toxin n=1 Tax=Pontivivens ytuae TaxID=2789856 RepID=A0A7S9LVC6_9RHOB|nr:type II toxin-antitoxin system RelE/ParE family toxin [Pontivivens ytuae]QPH56012.1 type II toxin-antitoxin system RelE/ParE family toxin [Pontivivens ytuae]